MDIEHKIDKIIKYAGGKNHITVLAEIQNQLVVFYARTHDMSIDIKIEKLSREYKEYKTGIINIPLVSGNSILYNLIIVKNESDFDLIEQVISSILEEKYE